MKEEKRTKLKNGKRAKKSFNDYKLDQNMEGNESGATTSLLGADYIPKNNSDYLSETSKKCVEESLSKKNVKRISEKEENIGEREPEGHKRKPQEIQKSRKK